MEESELEQQFGLDDILEASDDDNDEAAKKSTERLDRLIDLIKLQYKCDDEKAMGLIRLNPKWLDRVHVNRTSLNKVSLLSIDGREKMCKKLFEWTLNRIPFQQEMRMLLSLFIGENEKNNKNKNKSKSNETSKKHILKNWDQFQWPDSLLFLFVLQIGEWEYKKVKEMEKVDKNKNKNARIKYLRAHIELLHKMLVDSMFLGKGKDLRLHVLNAMEHVLNSELNVGKKKFHQCYDTYRNALLSETDKVKENFLYNYNSKRNKMRLSGNLPLVAIGGNSMGNNGNGGNFGNSNSNNSGGKNNICIWFNDKRGCNFGRNCNKNNVCFNCGTQRHNIFRCYKLLDEMMKNGTVQGYYEVNNNGPRHNPAGGIVIGVDGKSYRIANFQRNGN